MVSSKKLITMGLAGALAVALNSASASVLLNGWNGSGDSGFGDLAMQPNDDGSSQRISFNDFAGLGFDSGVNFFGTVYDSFFINNNGNITFNSAVGSYTPTPFPVSSQPMIAPFWADVDTSSGSGGEGGDAEVGVAFAAEASADNAVYIGSPNTDTLVVTWNEVGYFSANTSKTNTFQLVMIDREDTGAGNFDVEFRYENIEWTTGDASGGTDGLGGTPAQAGYDAGDNTNYYALPGSFTSEVVNLDTAPSNTGTPGVWTFAIREGELPGSTPANPVMPVVDPATPDEYVFEFEITEPDTPIFIDPYVAVGYDYIVSNGPNIASVILPEGFDDNMFDLFLWDDLLAEWVDSGMDLTGGIEHVFANVVDRFRIMGIEVGNMVDPTDATAFVTGLTFDGTGTVNMNQNAVSVFVDDGSTPVPAPAVLLLALVGVIGVFARRK